MELTHHGTYTSRKMGYTRANKRGKGEEGVK